MSILVQILGFIGLQLLKALLTAQAVKDATLFLLKQLATRTKAKWDDKIYRRAKFYMTKDTSERIKLKDDEPKS